MYYIYNREGKIALPTDDVFTKGQQNVNLIYKYGIVDTDTIAYAKSIAIGMAIIGMYKYVAGTKTKGMISEKLADYQVTVDKMAYKNEIEALKKEVDSKMELLQKYCNIQVF